MPSFDLFTMSLILPEMGLITEKQDQNKEMTYFMQSKPVIESTLFFFKFIKLQRTCINIFCL